MSDQQYCYSITLTVCTIAIPCEVVCGQMIILYPLMICCCSRLTTLKITLALLFTTCFLLTLPFISYLLLLENVKEVLLRKLAFPIWFNGTRQGSTVSPKKEYLHFAANWQQLSTIHVVNFWLPGKYILITFDCGTC